MTTSKEATNGVANKNVTGAKSPKPELSNLSVVKTEIPEKPKVEEQPAVIEKPKVEEKPLASLQARLKKLAELQLLVERRELLTEHLDNVNAFDYKSPNANGTIKFTDSSNKAFQFSNPAVIAECVPMIKARLEKQIEEVESKIAFFF